MLIYRTDPFWWDYSHYLGAVNFQKVERLSALGCVWRPGCQPAEVGGAETDGHPSLRNWNNYMGLPALPSRLARGGVWMGKYVGTFRPVLGDLIPLPVEWMAVNVESGFMWVQDNFHLGACTGPPCGSRVSWRTWSGSFRAWWRCPGLRIQVVRFQLASGGWGWRAERGGSFTLWLDQLSLSLILVVSAELSE